MFQTVRFVPSRGETIKGYLASDAEGEAVVGKVLFEGSYEVLTDGVDLVVSLVGVTFGGGCVTANRGDVY